MQKIIEAEHLVKEYGFARVIDDVSFSVKEGEIYGIVGPDGAGKTTTVRLVSGIIDVTAGEVRLAGFDIKKELEKARRVLGYMPQRFSLYEDLSVEENIGFFADIYGISRTDRKKRIDELYGFSHLERFKDRQARFLSGGMQKKLALSCALINFPKILILDEPTIGVDPLSRQELWEMLTALNKNTGITILVTTNYMDEVNRFDRVALIYRGKFISEEIPKEVNIRTGGSFEDYFISKIESIGVLK
ncbi:MAG: ABC transporter ATP-binding protein [Candidatus Firestonebacteria bacterium]